MRLKAPKKGKSVKMVIFSFLFLFLLAQPLAFARGEKTVEQKLAEIQTELKKLNLKINSLIEGHKKLSKEHDGIRVRIHRRG